MELKRETSENFKLNSELSSSLVTSYNSDDREEELRVSELRKTRKKESSTQRSMTSPKLHINVDKQHAYQTKIRTDLKTDKNQYLLQTNLIDKKRLNSCRDERSFPSVNIFLDSSQVPPNHSNINN